ncbi:hypothetical protein A0H76_1706 [Hepatospora eriocheir]|uniref:DUF5097 domain-containing protein n=1 Tax=Hepatospora eriocheir TaxID=1081669 RepID=A0A1X0QLJ1_9MICR|nr:hypothetical protein A0H76_1706 [Hepatospora eriocheir]
MFKVPTIPFRKYIVKYILNHPSIPLSEMAVMIHTNIQDRFFTGEIVERVNGTSSDKYVVTKMLVNDSKMNEVLVKRVTDENSVEEFKLAACDLQRVNNYTFHDIYTFLDRITLQTPFGVVLRENIIDKINNPNLFEIPKTPKPQSYRVPNFFKEDKMRDFDLSRLKKFKLDSWEPEEQGKIIKLYNFFKQFKDHLKINCNITDLLNKIKYNGINISLETVDDKESIFWKNFTLKEVSRGFDELDIKMIVVLFKIAISYLERDMLEKAKFWDINIGIVFNEYTPEYSTNKEIRFSNDNVSWTLSNWKERVYIFIENVCVKLNNKRFLKYQEYFSSESEDNKLIFIEVLDILMKVCMSSETFRQNVTDKFWKNTKPKKNLYEIYESKSTFNCKSSNLGTFYYKDDDPITIFEMDNNLYGVHKQVYYSLDDDNGKILHDFLDIRIHSQKFLKMNLGDYYDF